jgi:hypothetical protein
MSLDVVWTVKIGDIDSPTDFTDRVTGIGIRQPLRWMRPSIHTATITLNNFDGALTPADGGGAGTYSTVDWLAQAVYISATVNTTDTAEVMHGIVSKFELIDDGTSSTVILTVADPLSYISRDVITILYSSETITAARGIAEVLDDDEVGVRLPLLGKTFANVLPVVVTPDPDESVDARYQLVDVLEATLPATVSDILVNQVMPSNITLLWSTRIEEFPSDSTGVAYGSVIVGGTFNRISGAGIPSYANPTTFKLVETSPSANELTFTKLEMGYDSAGRYNAATVTSISTYTGTKTFSHTNTAAADDYGQNRWTATQTVNDAPESTQTQAEAVANRFGPVVFTTTSVELTTPNLADNPDTSKQELAALLDAANLWQRVDIEYTPTGAAGSITVEAVIFGRTINARPGRTSIVLDLVPASLWSGFTLNSNTLGKLDEDRLV